MSITLRSGKRIIYAQTPVKQHSPALGSPRTMKYSITYDNRHRFFLIETEGDFDYESYQELAECLLKNDDWSPHSHCLFDYRKTDFLKVDKADIQKMGFFHQRNNFLFGSGKSAFVMRCPGNFGMARMYQGSVEPHVDARINVFTDFDKAQSWIANGDDEAY